jgi:hypothetical protein
VTGRTFRRWILPSVIMGVCLATVHLLGWNAGALVVGWFGGALAAAFHPDVRNEA